MTASNRVLLGEDNPLSDLPENALYNWPINCAGWRLQRILGLTGERYLGLDRANLCSPSWDVRRARDRARLLSANGTPFRTIVMLGRRVAAAFEHALDLELRPFHYYRVDDLRGAACEAPDLAPLTLVSLPHPSGRCHVWNDLSAVHRARRLLDHVAPHVPWGSWREDYDAQAERVFA